jgi:segregation and condensation protein B
VTETSVNRKQLSSIVESLVFASPEPLSVERIIQILKYPAEEEIRGAIEMLNEMYDREGRAFFIREIAGGFTFTTKRHYSRWIRELFRKRRVLRLSKSSLETLAIVAYRQPVVKAEIELLRGVSVDGVIHNLLQKKLIEIAGRKETLGRPILYRTTDTFLKYFGLKSTDELPPLEDFEELYAKRGIDIPRDNDSVE